MYKNIAKVLLSSTAYPINSPNFVFLCEGGVYINEQICYLFCYRSTFDSRKEIILGEAERIALYKFLASELVLLLKKSK